MTKKKIDWRIMCTGLVCITGLNIYTLSQGINGTVLTITIGTIAGVIGWSVPQLKTK